MNIICRAKISSRIRLSSLYSIASLQQLNLYSTSKTPKSTYPRTPKSPGSSWSFSERIKEPTGEANVWPKPNEIPYQAKVANFVNLIGYVKAPVRFDTASEGKHFATTAISQESTGRNVSLLIPVLFEGDLAHVVATHVKENDCVLVSGQLSQEPLRFALKDCSGEFHVVCENLNFVAGFKGGPNRKKSDVSVFAAKIEKPVDSGIRNEKEFDQKEVKKFSGETNGGSSSVSLKSNVGSEKAVKGFGEAKLKEEGSKKKDGDRNMDLWRDLVKNSLLWWDYRDQKAKGLVQEKFPDFKHKETGDALWFDSAPKWVLPGIGMLEFDVPAVKQKFVQRRTQGYGVKKSNCKEEDSWKDLVENPSKWWDNRADKRNPKAPDFKEKESGKGLWLSNLPDWAASKLPPLK